MGVGFGSNARADAGVTGFKISKIGEKEFMQGFNNVEVVPGLGQKVQVRSSTRVRIIGLQGPG